MFRHKLVEIALLAVILLSAGAAIGVRYTQGQEPDQPEESTATLGSSFTYQGELSSDGAPINDSCTFTFTLYDDAGAGNQIGDTQTESAVPVEDGRFTVVLNDEAQFGPNAFNGEARWLDIAVQCSADDGVTALGRQPLTAAPQAQYALSAGNAASAPWEGITGVPADLADGDDDTTYSAGAGLALDNGQFSVTPPYQLPQSCANGQLPSWNGTAWLCADDQNTTYSAGAGLVLNGTEFNVQGNTYENVIVVAKNGGDFNTITAALGSIEDATASNRYLIWIAPGLYQEQVTMIEYVDIEGAGENLTIISANGGSVAPTDGSDSATLRATPNSELRRLTVASDGTNQDHAIAIDVRDLDDSFRLGHVTVAASSGSSSNTGIHISNASPVLHTVTVAISGAIPNNYGIHNEGASPTITDVNITVTGNSTLSYGIRNDQTSSVQINGGTISVSGSNALSTGVSNVDSSAKITNLTVFASGVNGRGVQANGTSSATIHHSLIHGSTYGITEDGGTIAVATSQLSGDDAGPAGNFGNGDFTCVHSYNQDFVPLDEACDPIAP